MHGTRVLPWSSQKGFQTKLHSVIFHINTAHGYQRPQKRKKLHKTSPANMSIRRYLKPAPNIPANSVRVRTALLERVAHEDSNHYRIL